MWKREEKVLRSHYMFKKTNKKQNKLVFNKLSNVDVKFKDKILE